MIWLYKLKRKNVLLLYENSVRDRDLGHTLSGYHLE